VIGKIVAMTAAGVALVALCVACGSSGEGGREVSITQGQAECSPKVIEAAPGEKLNLVVTNDSDKEPYELEGEGGAKLEEIVVPEGKTREVGFDVPEEAGNYELKCYVPGDIETIIEVVVGAESSPRY
jgi:Cupredoxin-like domain